MTEVSGTRIRAQIEIIEFKKDIYVATQTIREKTISNLELHAILSDISLPIAADEAKLPDNYSKDIFISMLTFEKCIFTADAFTTSNDFTTNPLAPLLAPCHLISLGFEDTALTMVQAEQLIKTRIDSINCFALSLSHSDGPSTPLMGGICNLMSDVTKRIFAS